MVNQTQRKAFVEALRNLGGSAGNGSLREALEWDEATYLAVKEDQVRAGVVIPGRGRGGSVALTGTAAQGQVPLAKLPDQEISREPAPPSKRAKSNGNGGNLGFEAELFKAADKLRGNMEPSDYKHVALGLIFLKHISDSFEAKRDRTASRLPRRRRRSRRIFRRQHLLGAAEARWSHLQANAKQPSIGKMIDEAMIAIEKRQREPQGRAAEGVCPARAQRRDARRTDRSDFRHRARPEKGEARDVLGRVYEYFLGQFAGSEGKRGGEFYTPRSVVRRDGRDDRAVQRPRVRSVLRLGRHVRAVREIRRRARRPHRRHRHLWAGVELHDVAALQDEPRRSRHRRGHQVEQRRQLSQGRTARSQGRFRSRQSAVQHLRLGRRTAARGRALEIWRSARRQRQLRLGAAHRASPFARLAWLASCWRTARCRRRRAARMRSAAR